MALIERILCPECGDKEIRRGFICRDCYTSVDRRLYSQLATQGECLVWTGSCTRFGYGHMQVGGVLTVVHRVVWEREVGHIPEGMFVLHKCDNPPCCRPDHLFLGTKKDNAVDMVNKGRLKTPGLRGDNHPNSKLTKEKVYEIRKHLQEGVTQRELSRRYGVSWSAIHQIHKGRIWKEEAA